MDGAMNEANAALVKALLSADLSGYKDSMRPLIERDIDETVRRLCNISAEDGKQ